MVADDNDNNNNNHNNNRNEHTWSAELVIAFLLFHVLNFKKIKSDFFVF